MKKRRNTAAVRPVQPRLFDNKKLAALLIPLALDQLLNSFMGTVDILVVSNLGSAAISAVSLVDSINVLVIQAFFALASGGTVVCSHYLGCKKENHAREAARQLVFITFIMSLIIAGVCLALNLVFVWVFHWGVAGSASATMLARIFSMAVVTYKLRNPDLEIPLRNYFSIRPDWKEIKRILHIGIPSGVENSMFQFGKLAIQSTVSLMGTAAIAAQGMTNIIENLNGILAMGVGVGLMTVVGESLGAGRREEAVYYIKKLCIISEIIVAASCLVMYALVRPITHFGGMEPASAKMCIFMVTWITIVKPLVWVMAFIPAYGLRAAGDVKFSMTVSVLSMWLCRVTLAMILARVFHMGPMAVWIGMFTDWTIRCVIFTIRFKNRKWLNHQVI